MADVFSEIRDVQDAHFSAAAREYYFVFNGNAGEYFKIWLANTLLSLLTLGVYSAWATVRTKRYFYANTYLDGNNFDYHAKPLSILLARLILVILFVGGGYWAGEDFFRKAAHSLLLLLLLPWAVVRGMAFNARYTSYRSVRFSFRKTYMRIYVLYLPVIVAMLLLYYLFMWEINENNFKEIIIVAVVLFLFVMALLPAMTRAFHRVKAEGHAWGQLFFGFRAPQLLSYVRVIWGVLLAVLLFFTLLTSLLFSVINMSSEGAGMLLFMGLSVIIFYIMVFAAFVIVATALFRLFWNSIVFSGGKTTCYLSLVIYIFRIEVVNMLAMLFSLGLLYPWAKIRKIRYLLSQITVVAPVGAAAVATAAGEGESALGAEFAAAEGFDFDIGII